MLNRITILTIISLVFSQSWFNHPELEWRTIETEHFYIHFHVGAERSASEVADVSEFIYKPVTDMYNYRPNSKTHIIIRDTDDISNGSAFFFDNKIEIWASPLDFDLRGSHRWIQNVITHEFTHIIQLAASLKYNRHLPSFYIQQMDYEDEKKRNDVLYGYPNKIVSYAVPSITVPPWFAEGVAQCMYDDANFDYWDTHRDMILRDAFLHSSVFGINEMNTFGKTGTGNEQVYIQGFSLAYYIAQNYGDEVFKDISMEISKPYRFSFENAVKKVIDKSLYSVYDEWYMELKSKYEKQASDITAFEGNILVESGTASIHPVWAPNDEKFIYLSNSGKDYFGQTDLYVYDFSDSTGSKLVSGVFSAPAWLNDSTIIFSKRSKPNEDGSKFYDLYSIDLNDKKHKPNRLTTGMRLTSPAIDINDNIIAAIGISDGVSNIYTTEIDSIDNLKFIKRTTFADGEKIFSLSIDDGAIIFDIVFDHGRDIMSLDLSSNEISVFKEDITDERDPFISGDDIYISSDADGIFNIYRSNDEEYHKITNVSGGAFMPSVSSDGKILFSLYKDGKFRISLIDLSVPHDMISINTNYDSFTKSNSQYLQRERYNSTPYDQNLSLPFIFPRLMVDYGTLKPGFYFYSSDPLNKYFLFGGASVNKINDLDIFLLFELNRYKPSFYANFFWVTRNLSRQDHPSSVNELEYDNITFKADDTYMMFSADLGSRLMIKGQKLSVNYNYSKYRAHSIGYTRIYHDDLLQYSSPFDISYDYFRGHKLLLEYHFSNYSPRYASNMIPQNGYEVNADISIEKNDFDPKFEISEDYGTLSLVFSDHNTQRVNLGIKKNLTLNKKKRVVYNQSIDFGYLTNKDIDDFFYYFGGGMTGVRGYTFYEESLSGTQLLASTSTIMIPLFLEKNYRLLHLIIQNLSINYMFQAGGVDAKNLKYSNGLECRINGSSFYAFPFALSYEYHLPLNDIDEKYGKHYFKLLFEFI